MLKEKEILQLILNKKKKKKENNDDQINTLIVSNITYPSVRIDIWLSTISLFLITFSKHSSLSMLLVSITPNIESIPLNSCDASFLKATDQGCDLILLQIQKQHLKTLSWNGNTITLPNNVKQK